MPRYVKYLRPAWDQPLTSGENDSLSSNSDLEIDLCILNDCPLLLVADQEIKVGCSEEGRRFGV